MKYYPVFLDLEGKKALVVGGGRVAERKVETLLEYGAVISIISKDLTDKLNVLIDSGDVQYLGAEFEEVFPDGLFLVIAATDDKQLNHRVSESARRKGLLVNAVDQPADCTFIVPSIVKRGDLLIAISTSGKSPALARKIREEMEKQFGEEYEAFLMLLGRLREAVLSRGFPQSENSRIFRDIVDSPILEALAKGCREEIRATLSEILPEEIRIDPALCDFKKC